MSLRTRILSDGYTSEKVCSEIEEAINGVEGKCE